MILSEFTRRADKLLAPDRKLGLPAIAQTLQRAALERPWDRRIKDMRGAHFLSRYLEQAVPEAMPEDALSVAAGRDFKDLAHHQRAVARFLAEAGLSGQHVLVLTDFVQKGGTLEKLVAHTLAAGAASVDVAVLTSVRDPQWDGWPSGIDRLFVDSRDSGLFENLICNATGLACVAGQPEPVVDPNCDPEQTAYVNGLIDRWAEEFRLVQAIP